MGIGGQKWKKYLRATNARHDFQINLGIALLNYGISLDWVGDEWPDYMRSGEFVPCNCNMCYFCINGYTSGIAHAGDKRKVAEILQTQTGTIVMTEDCTEYRVKIQNYTSYCRMCYRNQEDSLSWEEKRDNCKGSTMGCAICREPICKKCWAAGYDKHQSD